MGKNLNFCPTPGKYNKKILQDETNQFLRRVKLKSYFGETTAHEKTEEQIFRPKSDWVPTKIHHSVETFCEAVKNELKNSNGKNQQYRNLSNGELEAMEELRKRDDLIFSKADKGGALVIMDVDDYIKEANRQLDDTEFYRKLQNDPTATYSERINKAIDKFQNEGLITEKVANGLKIDKPKASKFNLSPKIHKKNNPGRPVINSVNCHSSKISQYVDFHLQPEVCKLKSYVKDSTDAINKLSAINNDMQKEDILVTMDVRSLYTNIPNGEGIQAVRDSLNASSSRIPTRVITTFLTLILTLNNFIFNGVNYLQTKGCAMGTKCAPTYANIFMGKFENTHIYPRISNKTRIFLRYMDDLFFVWKGTEQELKHFLEEINKVHPTIKFDFKYSTTEIEFLDLKIFKDFSGKMFTKVYTKPTDRQAYLHKKSAHPNHLKKSIPYGQALRLRRVCTETQDYDEASEALKSRLKERGYKEEEIVRQINEAKSRQREDLLQYKQKEPLKRIPFVLTYYPDLPNAKAAVEKHWQILHINPKMKSNFAEKPIMAYRRNQNLGDILGQKTLLNNKVVRKGDISNQSGCCNPCLTRSDNLCCKQIRQTSTFQSRKTKRKYKIFHKVSCKSKFIIYLLECTRCRIQYVGKSEWPMNIRLNKHRNDVFREDAIQVCKHFKEPGHEFNKHAKITIIEELKKKDRSLKTMRKILEQREDFWILKLKTLQPDGFNMELNDNNNDC